MKRFWLGIFIVGLYGLLASCSGTRVLMQTAPSKAKGPLASPALALTTQDHWETIQAPDIAKTLETHLYGQFPQNFTLTSSEQQRLDGTYFDDSAVIDIETLTLTNAEIDARQSFGLVIVRPKGNSNNGPIIMMENFCPNHDVIPAPGIPKPRGDYYFDCSGGGIMGSVFGYFFGRYITTPPIADIMRRGYSLAVIFPTEFVPDSDSRAPDALNRIYANQDPATRTRAIMAWAHQFSELSAYLKTAHGFSRTIAYGHSRYGKAALVAGAYDSTIDAVIAHQSGTGGASLFKDGTGESIAQITENYSHWFADKLRDYAETPTALPFDQHQLLALIAPRPVLLGNARRDVWSDPNGAFRSAEAASAVYALYGSDGLTQDKLTAFNPQADLAFWMRPGTHGVVKEDWPAFLDFLDAHK